MHPVNASKLSCIGLLFLSLIPCVAGLFRLYELGFGSDILPTNTRIELMPVPAIIHILSSVIFCLLGAWQLTNGNWRAKPDFHRYLGRVLVVAGLICALSGQWMTHYYPFPEALQGDLLYTVRLFVSIAMVVSIGLGVLAIIYQRTEQHRAWIIRAYALAQGAGTQAVISLPWILSNNEPIGLARDILMSLAWVINIGGAEFVIRKTTKTITQTRSTILHVRQID